MEQRIRAFIFTFLLCLIIAESGCNAVNHTTTTQSPYWHDMQDVIITNDMERLQQKLPFTLIIPKYLPQDIRITGAPEFTAYLCLPDTEDVEVQIFYDGMESDSDRIIKIKESSSPREWGVNTDMEPMYIDFAGIKVLEMRSTISIPVNGQLIDESILYYQWNNNNVGFDASFIAFTQSECRMIVESMIK